MHLPLNIDFVSHNLFTTFSLAFFALIAGYIDSVVGGGGLIQLPALLINLPKFPVPTLFGTNKIASICGTSMAAFRYSRRVKFNYRLLITVCIISAAASFAGARAVSFLNVNILKPLILVVLILIACYTYKRKDLGAHQKASISLQKQIMYGAFIALVVGFYDGFFGPGAGSFLILGFVVLLGFEFIQASAYSKAINTMTNLGAISVFVRQGNFILDVALIMAACNVTGSILGTHTAMKMGNKFVRRLFLAVVTLMILRYAWDIVALYLVK